ncbi:MAG: hypothetical protein RL748_1608, partial [Pseudomonadota bacterium]
MGNWMRRCLARMLVALAAMVATGLSNQVVAQENGELVDVKNGQLHVLKMGQGPQVVIFESGFMSDLRVWQKVAPAIAKNAQVVLYSRAGVGQSPPRKQALNLSQHVEELKQLIDTLKVTRPVILVGHSYGGWVVRQFAAGFPQQVAALVLVDPANETLELELKKIDAQKVAQDQQRLASMAPPQAKAGLALVQAIFDQARLPDSANLPDVPTVLLTSIQPARKQPFFQETAPALQVKRQLHAGLLQNLSNASHIVTDGSGHHIQQDEPHLVVAAIEQILQGMAFRAAKLARQQARQKSLQEVQQAMGKASALMQANQAVEATNAVYSALKVSMLGEADINQIGFDLLTQTKQAGLAELVLRFNVAQFPESDNALDSHGEALLELKRPQEAKTQFLKALELARSQGRRSPKVMRAYEDNVEKAAQAIAL